MNPILEVKNVHVERRGRTILRDLSLDVSSGNVIGVLGPSGSGKSSLFRCIAGEWHPLRGEIRFDGHALGESPIWKRAQLGIGYIPQEPSVFGDLTVLENLSLYAKLTHEENNEAERAASVGLDTRLTVRADDLSAGERRRLEFLRATTKKPKLLICDEPFAGVDPKAASHLGQLLVALAASGTAVVLADHHVEEALAVCTEAHLMLDGQLLVGGTPEVFRSNDIVRSRYLRGVQ